MNKVWWCRGNVNEIDCEKSFLDSKFLRSILFFTHSNVSIYRNSIEIVMMNLVKFNGGVAREIKKKTAQRVLLNSVTLIQEITVTAQIICSIFVVWYKS